MADGGQRRSSRAVRAPDVYKAHMSTHLNADACSALGIAGGTFGRLCRQYGIETPFARQRNARSRARRIS